MYISFSNSGVVIVVVRGLSQGFSSVAKVYPSTNVAERQFLGKWMSVAAEAVEKASVHWRRSTRPGNWGSFGVDQADGLA